MTSRQQRSGRPIAGEVGVGFVILTFEFHKEGGYWVGQCRELGTATDGRSLDRVERELGKLVLLHLNGLEDIGERERFFKEHKIKLYKADVPKEIARTVPVAQDSTLIQFRSVRLPARPRELVGASSSHA